MACGWWNQIVTVGRTASISLLAILLSGSENGRGPGYSGSHRTPLGRQPAEKLRLRSTPRAFWRTPRARPSGFRFGRIQRSIRLGGASERSRRVIAIPAGSFP
jgi:hypothetical protein